MAAEEQFSLGETVVSDEDRVWEQGTDHDPELSCLQRCHNKLRPEQKKARRSVSKISVREPTLKVHKDHWARPQCVCVCVCVCT